MVRPDSLFYRSLYTYPSWASSSSETERTNTYHSGGNGDGIDRISDMPDLVLEHILSFMDMEDVVANTRLISKRWRHLWKSLPILNFNRDTKSFTKFVDKVLKHRALFDNNSVIKSLRISFHLHDFGRCHHRNGWRISKKDWIFYAAKQKVEELCFYIRNHKNEHYDFTWPKSSKIQIYKVRAQNDLLMPHSLFSDTQLRTLELEFVKFSDGYYSRRKDVVTLSCSVLENLTINCCSHGGVELLNISAPKLKNLEIQNEDGWGIDECKLEISTPNLTSLILRGPLYENYSFENISSLVKATFECCYKVSDAGIIRNILESLHNATTLELCGELQRSSARSLQMDHQLFNTFVNLKCLKLIGWSGDSCSHTIHSLLMNSYSLEALALEINHVCEAHDWGELFPCIYSLKSFEIKGIQGCENELNLFEFILKNALVLEDFTIYRDRRFGRCNSREERSKFNMKIDSLPRASSSVKILGISLN